MLRDEERREEKADDEERDRDEEEDEERERLRCDDMCYDVIRIISMLSLMCIHVLSVLSHSRCVICRVAL